MTLDKYTKKMANDIGEPATFWHLCNIRSAYYHKYGKYPSKEEFDSFGSKLVGVQPRPSADALKAIALDKPKKKKRSERVKKKEIKIKKNYHHLIKNIKYGNRCNNRKS